MEGMETTSPVSARSKSALSPSDNLARRAARNSRVHFDEDGYIPVLQEANPIQVQVVGEERSRTVALYLGFLQEEHKYALTATILPEMCGDFLLRMSSSSLKENNGTVNAAGANGGPDGPKDEDSSSPELVEKGKFCDVSSMMWINEENSANHKGLEIQLEVTVPSTATLEGHNAFEDTMKICAKGRNDSFIRLQVSAKVMGKSMGTPILKDGIRCVGLCPDSKGSDDSSDTSDADEAK